jgi:hypothetical protein
LFLVPVLAQALLSLVFGGIEILSSISGPGGAAAGFGKEFIIMQAISVGFGTVNWCVGLLTLAWFSIWMGVTSRKLNLAMIKTFSFVKIIPWFVAQFASVLIFIASMRAAGASGFWLYPVLHQGILLIANIFLIFLAREHSKMAITEWAETPAI